MDSKILITTGDPDGVGWEVTAKALEVIGPKRGVQFVYFRPAQNQTGPRLSKKFKHKVVASLNEAAEQKLDPKIAIEVRSVKPPPLWVEEAARACLDGRFQALVTAPLSKTSILAAGLKDIGHTEILARVSGSEDLFMGFLGKKFSVVLASGHKPLARALAELTPRTLAKAIEAGARLRSLLPAVARKRPLAVVGINPHAGEDGVIGTDETWLKHLVAQSAPRLGVVGPLVPDAAFLPANWARYSVYICPYHDQGLIPFKLVHGFDSGVHLTLGLPFVRTSVDHGTAKDIFGQNKARPGSMKDALTVAVRLAAFSGGLK